MVAIPLHRSQGRSQSRGRAVRVTSRHVAKAEQQIITWLNQHPIPTCDMMVLSGQLSKPISPLIIRVALAELMRKRRIMGDDRRWELNSKKTSR